MKKLQPDAHEAVGGIQSLDTALRVLSILADSGKALPLSELARLCDLPPTKVHRYLASFCHSGILVQNGRSGTYDLGKGAMRLGLAAMLRYDFVNTVADHLPDLVRGTNLTALLCVWGNSGPTIVRWERSASLMVTSLGLGSTLPLLTSATGRVCLAFLPETLTGQLVDQELKALKQRSAKLNDFKISKTGVKQLASDIRETGFASIDGRFIPGLVAIAAPILDWQNHAQATVTLIGTDANNLSIGSDAVAALTAFCTEHSVLKINDV